MSLAEGEWKKEGKNVGYGDRRRTRGTRGEYAFFPDTVGFLDAAERASSAPIRLDRPSRVFPRVFPRVLRHTRLNGERGSISPRERERGKQSGREENRSVALGKFSNRRAASRARVLSHGKLCHAMSLRPSDSTVTRDYFR